MLLALGNDAGGPDTRTSDACLAAAARTLEGLLSAHRFARDSALELLAIDALTTCAFEHASQTSASERELESLAERGTRLLAQLITQRV
jgi:hypothetical protein